MILYDRRIGGIKPRRIITQTPHRLMLIPDEIRKCAFFIGHRTDHGTYTCMGTAFLLSQDIRETPNNPIVYAVTAQHVIGNIKKQGGYKIYLRVNDRRQGFQWEETDLEEWVDHNSESVDISIFKYDAASLNDVIPYRIESIVTQSRIQELEIGVGDDVFLTGLFSFHAGTEKNIPIIRVGNIAAMPEERIFCTDFGLGLIDAYLVETRSIGGLSGSPVFVHLGTAKYRSADGSQRPGDIVFYLLGVMHGHWDSGRDTGPDSASDASDLTLFQRDKINTGIAIVSPAWKIMEIINQPRLTDLRSKHIKDVRSKSYPTPDWRL